MSHTHKPHNKTNNGSTSTSLRAAQITHVIPMLQKEWSATKLKMRNTQATTMKNIKMLILIVLIRKYRVHTQYIILTYSATILAR
jgi:hypothetical protein